VAGQDIVVDLATSIPPFSKAARKGAWKMNDAAMDTSPTAPPGRSDTSA
jgi:hypothetical protein